MDNYWVLVGQIWQDWDTRFRQGKPRIIRIESISGDGQYATCKNIDTGRITKIAIKRLKPSSNGYKLLKQQAG